MSKCRDDLPVLREDRTGVGAGANRTFSIGSIGFRIPKEENDAEICGQKVYDLPPKMVEEEADETSVTETEDMECQHEVLERHYDDTQQQTSQLSIISENDENDCEVPSRDIIRRQMQTLENESASMIRIDNDNDSFDIDDFSRVSATSSNNNNDFMSDSMRKVVQIASQTRLSISKAAHSTHKKVGKFTNKARIKIFGEEYTKKEGLFVVIVGCIVSLNIGMINGTTLSGLLGSAPSTVTTTTSTAAAVATATTTKRSVMGFSTYYTLSALAMADGDWDAYAYNVGLILSYVLGAFIAGILTPKAQPYRIEPTYGPTFVIGGLFLLTASLLAAYEFRLQYVFYCCSVANGIQNGVASIYSSNLIRCGITGMTTDAALAFAQLLRGNRRKPWKSIVIVLVIVSFWFGGLLAFWLSRRFLKYTLFFNTIIFWLVGISLILFLVKQLKISIRNAIFGTWSWRTVFEQLAKSSGLPADTAMTHERLLDLFEELDDDGNGYIDPDELMVGLLRCGVSIKSSQIKVLVNSADSNNDGLIDRDEWAVMVRKML